MDLSGHFLPLPFRFLYYLGWSDCPYCSGVGISSAWWLPLPLLLIPLFPLPMPLLKDESLRMPNSDCTIASSSISYNRELVFLYLVLKEMILFGTVFWNHYMIVSFKPIMKNIALGLLWLYHFHLVSREA